VSTDFLTWLGWTPNGRPLDVGEPAPDAALFDLRGAEVSLRHFYGRAFTLIYFFPKANTHGCTKQACSLRDDFEPLTRRGVTILGISADGPETQRRFSEKLQLPFILLADPKRAAARAFGVPLLAGMPRRQAFLIQGARLVWRDLQADTTHQAATVLRALDQF
jgi:peroxiredoxin Q/BCP